MLFSCEVEGGEAQGRPVEESPMATQERGKLRALS